jgi:copper(I)-binding protein
MKKLFAFALSLFLLCNHICANEQGVAQNDKIKIIDPWVRPSSGRPNSAAYMQIQNRTNEDITVSSAVSEVANLTELHQSVEERGVMKMHAVDKLVIPARDTIALKPKGTHIMLMKLKENLEEGQIVKITINTDNAGSVVVEAPVRKQIMVE